MNETKMEHIDTINESIKIIEKSLEDKGYYELFDSITITHIGDNIFCIEKNKEIWYYSDANGEVIFNVASIADNNFAKKSSIYTGYIEINSRGKYNMYQIFKVNGIPITQFIKHNIKNKTLKYKLTLGNKVDNKSLKYFQIRKDIRFFNHLQGISELSTNNLKGEFIRLNEGYIKSGIESESLRLKDLILFRDNGQINNELYKKYESILVNKLINQIGDDRFRKYNMPVTIEEIDSYYNKKVINSDQRRLLTNFIKELEN